MSVVAFDFETNGLPFWKIRSDDPKQPHIVQMALVVYSDAGVELSHECVIVRPDNWRIGADMTAIHGISHEKAMDVGVPEKEAAGLFMHHMATADLRVAHNESFDRRIARIALLRSGYSRELIEAFEARPVFCTCETAKPIVKAPPTIKQIKAGFTGFKSPNLGECIRHFFGEEIEGAHDALVDARCSGRIYWHITQKVNA